MHIRYRDSIYIFVLKQLCLEGFDIVQLDLKKGIKRLMSLKYF